MSDLGHSYHIEIILGVTRDAIWPICCSYPAQRRRLGWNHLTNSRQFVCLPSTTKLRHCIIQVLWIHARREKRNTNKRTNTLKDDFKLFFFRSKNSKKGPFTRFNEKTQENARILFTLEQIIASNKSRTIIGQWQVSKFHWLKFCHLILHHATIYPHHWLA